VTASITTVSAQTIAQCGKTEGYALYHYSGIVKKKDSGFTKDTISDGLNTLVKISDGKYDILMVDARKKIISLTQEGGTIILLRKGINDATFMHFYQDRVIEIYTFWNDGDGKAHYDLIQSKGGDYLPLHKSAVLTGDCERIDFKLIN